MSKYKVIIGLEIHTELKTASKMFCFCANNPTEEKPNKNICPICMGHPGTLPAINEQAIRFAVLLALALKSNINKFNKFDRKNYFYPDLPKGYQISQYDLPLAEGGSLSLGNDREIDITRLHLEEDTGKLSHGQAESSIDYNRAGIPLIEMVTEPVIKSAQEAKLFCQRFRQILRYLDISDADMEKGLMRCEANISLQTAGSWQYLNGKIEATGNEILNPKVEIKNINSFRSVEKAIEYEIKRQTELLDSGKTIKHETRGWDENKNETKAQRTKETQADYRYFPEPDLPPLNLSDDFIEETRSQIVELPFEKSYRFQIEYGLPENDIEFLIENIDLADFYEEIVSELKSWIEAEGDNPERQSKHLAKIAANWLITEFSKNLNTSKLTLTEAKIKITAENLAELVKLVYKNQINSSAGQTILEKMFTLGGDPTDIMKELGLEQLNDEAELEKIIKKTLADNKAQADEFKSGKEALAKFFIGKVMAATGGKANPTLIMEILNKLK
ncbi:MAG: Asp-tRNA(Asn)/Glu-tRNA(Gln) amidotransferase subunit GatB [Patescibacteria group bacterium]|nr:Asp-tRNA(Asn)/Glu-tRNA(Gln) amidotransferase subunit GatB [Patescibacteria group bacterium]